MPKTLQRRSFLDGRSGPQEPEPEPEPEPSGLPIGRRRFRRLSNQGVLADAEDPLAAAIGDADEYGEAEPEPDPEEESLQPTAPQQTPPQGISARRRCAL